MGIVEIYNKIYEGERKESRSRERRRPIKTIRATSWIYILIVWYIILKVSLFIGKMWQPRLNKEENQW